MWYLPTKERRSMEARWPRMFLVSQSSRVKEGGGSEFGAETKVKIRNCITGDGGGVGRWENLYVAGSSKRNDAGFNLHRTIIGAVALLVAFPH